MICTAITLCGSISVEETSELEIPDFSEHFVADLIAAVAAGDALEDAEGGNAMDWMTHNERRGGVNVTGTLPMIDAPAPHGGTDFRRDQHMVAKMRGSMRDFLAELRRVEREKERRR